MAANMLKAALAYAKDGWPVFPCRADKAPYTNHGHNDATTNRKQIEEWWTTWPNANIGFSPGEASLVVVDFDPGNDPEQLRRNVGELPKTQMVVATPRGGQHQYFQLDQDERIASTNNKIADHVDVKSTGGYVLLPPSRTKDGEYSWAQLGDPAFRTDELIRVAAAAKEKSKDRDRWLIEADMPENVDAAIKWLRHDARIAIEGQGGDAMAYATAAHMKSFGISQILALDLMWEHWNPRCSPPWDAAEFDHFEEKVTNGYSYNTSPPGNITQAYKVAKTQELFKVQETHTEQGVELKAGRFRLIDPPAFDLVRPPDWLIDQFLPEDGYAILFGASGSFKTFLAIDIACSIASGSSEHWDVKVQGPVLFAAGEGRSNFPKRMRAWAHLHNRPLPNDVHLIDPVPAIQNDDLDTFLELAMTREPDGYALTIIDTVGRAMQGLNENAQEHASAFTALVQKIQYAFDGAVLAIHHTGHQEGERTRGSSVFTADADTIVRAHRKSKTTSAVSLSMVKQKDATEWEQPKIFIARKIEDHDSLAIDTPAPAEQVTATPPVKADSIMLPLVERVTLEILQQYPSKTWSERKLAEQVARHEDIDIKYETVRGHLRELKLDKKSKLFEYYDPSLSANAGQWQYKKK